MPVESCDSRPITINNSYYCSYSLLCAFCKCTWEFLLLISAQHIPISFNWQIRYISFSILFIILVYNWGKVLLIYCNCPTTTSSIGSSYLFYLNPTYWLFGYFIDWLQPSCLLVFLLYWYSFLIGTPYLLVYRYWPLVPLVRLYRLYWFYC